MNHHCPFKQVRYLKEVLSQGRSKLGFFIAAGCPVAIKVKDSEDRELPLIPDVGTLTKDIYHSLNGEDNGTPYGRLNVEIEKTGKLEPNIEEILSFSRALKSVSIGGDVRGFNEGELDQLEKDICTEIVKKVDISLPNKQTPYHDFSNWITSIERQHPVEIFTTNYDLLLEEAFEDYLIPYFDGFVGARKSFFDLRAVEENAIPKHWTRVWKIHGSLNWFIDEKDNVYRTNETKPDGGAHFIYPSHLKYDQSRKMPFIALSDRLGQFLRFRDSILVISGYSFNDQHINDVIYRSLKANPAANVIALQFGPLEGYEQAISIAEKTPNLSVLAQDKAIVGTVLGKWKTSQNLEESEKAVQISVKNSGSDLHELLLGDFDKFGKLMKHLIGEISSETSNEQ